MTLREVLTKFSNDAVVTKKATFTITISADKTWKINFNFMGHSFIGKSLYKTVQEAHTWLIDNRKEIPPIQKQYTL